MLRNLAGCSSSELKNFLDSFDTVLCDCDGVVWKLSNLILGTKETILKLRQHGKKIVYVTNNSLVDAKHTQNKLNKFGIETNIDDVVNPTVAIISYLKKIQFDKNVYVIGTANMKQCFIDAGFTVAESGVEFAPSTKSAPCTSFTTIEFTIESFQELLNNVRNNKNVGAVIFDLDVNLTYLKIVEAQLYLENPNVIFITGATDKQILLGPHKITGQAMFQDALEEITGRVPLNFGKPGKYLNDYIVKKYNINMSNSSRILFIGDSLNQDIKFGTVNGYQTLLVLTGLTSLKMVTVDNLDRETIPDYYVDSLGSLNELIENLVLETE